MIGWGGSIHAGNFSHLLGLERPKSEKFLVGDPLEGDRLIATTGRSRWTRSPSLCTGSFWICSQPSSPIRAPTSSSSPAQGAGYAPGDWVMGLNKIEEFSTLAPDAFMHRIDATLTPSVTHYLSSMGAVGLTAWFGVSEIMKPEAGQTLLVSGAAGAVGSMVGQLARLRGARVVGIAGGPEKCARLIDRFGFDAAIDYRGRDLDALSGAIGAACPQGIDLVFENVGGIGLDATLLHINQKARIILCGLISEYNGAPHGTRNLWQLIVKTATMRGYLVSEFVDRFPEGSQAIADLIGQGKLVFDEHIDDGIDQAFNAFMRLFDGSNQGKMLLKLI